MVHPQHQFLQIGCLETPEFTCVDNMTGVNPNHSSTSPDFCSLQVLPRPNRSTILRGCIELKYGLVQGAAQTSRQKKKKIQAEILLGRRRMTSVLSWTVVRKIEGEVSSCRNVRNEGCLGQTVSWPKDSGKASSLGQK